MGVKPEVLCSTERRIERNIQHWACGDTHHNENQMASEMLELFAMWDDAAIGCEGFHVRQLAVEISPATIRAKIEYGLWLAEKWEASEEDRDMGRPRHLFKQEPSLAKRTLTDDRQRQYKLWEPGKDHKRDAVKHCYTFLQRAQESPRLRYFAWPHLFRTDGTLLKRRPSPTKRGMH
jgi:hypothetical protein